MISGTVKPNFWLRLLLSIIAIFALPNAQSFENQNNTENYSSSVSIQQALETVKVAREVQRQAIPQPSISRQTEKQLKIQPHFFTEALNISAPIRAGPLLI
ncbi:TPA: secA translation cis-regulator SecM [Haemophilus influenzae]|nr:MULTISPECIES: secA translation cis-regulator SecM [Haemophilus]ABQ98818.1 hypothetical protein CGSHiEE_07475 [Haemophilus influenzae PittEE]ADO96796.1 Hypothetical protein R2846_1409 [Haemophilus influenzae R2846]AJO88847.1 hypothetical protein NTHIC486_00074 [Haemophilus influenzae]AVI96090.1 hypothetical protein BV083_1051 [Haemophilus influenzae]AVI97863.1 hypothetical protein BV085_1049 [Haemophilus influenzae]